MISKIIIIIVAVVVLLSIVAWKLNVNDIFGTYAYFYSRQKSENICHFVQLKTNVTLVMLARNDGIGTRAMQIIPAIAYAHSRGWVFGGLTDVKIVNGAKVRDDSLEQCLSNSHGVDTKTFLRFLFGNDKDVIAPDLFGISSSDGFHTINSTQMLENFIVPKRNVLQDIVHLNLNYWPIHQHINPVAEKAIRASLNSAASCGVEASLLRTNYFSRNKSKLFNSSASAYPTTVNVAIHVRRSDITATSGEGRFVPDEYYLVLIETVKSLYPSARFHIFMSANLMHDIAELTANFSAPYIEVHADVEYDGEGGKSNAKTTEEAILAMAHMIKADVLITGKSTFSLLPGYFNTNCVIYMPFAAYVGFDDWIRLPDFADVNGTKEIIRYKLPRCFEKLHGTLKTVRGQNNGLREN